MALHAFFTTEGDTQGNIEGGCDISPHEGKMEIWGFNHEISSPRDAASGLPTGKRQHKPFTITKAVDKASPLLMAVLVHNENLPKWKLEIFRPSATGAEEHYYTVELVNANVCNIRQEQLNNKYAENMQHPFREHISYTYQAITWTYVDGGVTADDDWKVQKA
jgi:type VI secretion system secreted protein Hcp